MRELGDLLGLIGAILFVYTLFGRFIGDTGILGFTSLPFLGEGFTAVGTFSATACLLLLAVLAKIKAMEK